MESQTGHGGARPNAGGVRAGAGRKRAEPEANDLALRRVVVYLTGEQLGALVRIGGGSISSAVRQVIDESGYVLFPTKKRSQPDQPAKG